MGEGGECLILRPPNLTLRSHFGAGGPTLDVCGGGSIRGGMVPLGGLGDVPFRGSPVTTRAKGWRRSSRAVLL